MLKTDELFLLESLSRRRTLLDFEQEYFQKLLTGQKGEADFAALFSQICPGLDLLKDFQSHIYGQDLQIDALACIDQRLYHFEIKNYEFDFTYRQGQAFFGRSQKPISDPFRQLKRSRALLQQIIQNYSEPIELVSLVVFINESCKLTVDESCDSLCFSRQGIVNFLHNLSNGRQNKALTNWLQLQHRSLDNLHYTYEKLNMNQPVKPGLLCHECGCEMQEINSKNLFCEVCASKVSKSALKENLVKEYALLFPREILFSTKISHFYGNLARKNVIYSALKEGYEKISPNRRSGFHNPYEMAYILADLNRRKKLKAIH